MKHGALFHYLKDARVFRCPMDEPPSGPADADGGGTDRLTSYIMNGAVCGYGAVGNKTGSPPRWAPSWKITDWRDTSRQILMWEAEEGDAVGGGGASWNDGSSYPRENLLARRHGRGASVGCFDGHAEWMDRLDFIAEYQRPGPNRLYCDPHRPDGGQTLYGAFPGS